MEASNTKILHISDIELVPPNLEMPTPYFKCLFVCDARQIAADKINKAMSTLLKQGMVYLCAWGPDCERIQDIVDETVVMNEIEKGERGTIMTTWHEESLEEAWWFFETCTSSDEFFSSTYGSGVIIVVNNSQWQQQVEAIIAQNSA